MTRQRRRPGEFRLGFGVHLALWLALAVAVAWASGLLLTWLLGPATGPDRFDLVKIALTIAAGVGGVVALVVAFRKQHLSEAEHVRQEAAAQREQTKLFNERFGKAAELLSSDKSASRLAGVYAMAGLADDWIDGQQRCIDVLCAYLRMTSSKDFEERVVRHTVIRVVAAHLQRDASPSWQGRDFAFVRAEIDGGTFNGVVLDEGTTMLFDNANFNGDVRFNRAKFAGGRVSFRGATVHGGRLDFAGATVRGSGIDMSSMTVGGGVVSFDAVDFTTGHVDLGYTSFVGGDVTFHGARFVGATVWFRGARFDGGRVDIGDPAAYDVPPDFDSWPDGQPPGLTLPTGVR
ncbi:pentapeptide repeat-containing protein [Actinocrispum wychmicini]|uniref:Pentapeptide repeat protein n=1 Tax=Actinocrispum wychmicini TaxID=1213861 RepID=A0A4R2IXE5_9PSEU|nr:pentapeptide repeat-containing protein [Actinocrispum wychmicini]TCO48998.1 pentapeptide repeat protein [Actinocrispum wychmicini]